MKSALAAEEEHLGKAKAEVAALNGECTGLRDKLAALAGRYERSSIALEAAEATLAAAEYSHRLQLSECVAKLAATQAERDAWRQQLTTRAAEHEKERANWDNSVHELNQKLSQETRQLRQLVADQREELCHIKKRTLSLADEVRSAKIFDAPISSPTNR